MHVLLRNVLNAILSASTHFFEDGSRMDYYVRLDTIRYRTGEPVRRIVDVPLIYDRTTGLVGIKRNIIWKWRDPQVSLNAWSDSGPALSETEKWDLYQKLRLFVAKHPTKYEQFVGL
jgi:hypothetical protein